MTRPRKHYRTPRNTALCGRANAELVSLWADVECLECYKKKADFEAEELDRRYLAEFQAKANLEPTQ